ncbi:alpha/beta fold hydrolase [Alteromonas sp. ASW11-36]|uniref:Alpha/beta fold hydrolase n=1 Tax=Alteromonas arenosi TaxID=3055817 RepID=A0ABT7SYB7_9ALTE|nr:alpha/beta family hydrolase [Alteromonas sp. ASW11-36]MDM7861183.1 alpha/beta fold hydrolase [Alteromonas sp. ASW11-36]
MQIFKSPSDISVRGQVILGHGAGAGMHSEFMQQMASLLAQNGVTTWLFNFPYMQRSVAEGKKRPPDRMPKLLSHITEVVTAVSQSADFDTALPLALGGKSMGGRAATMWLADPDTPAQHKAQVAGVVVLGYPFHPPGKPDALRVEHLATMDKPGLVLQGERDTFGNRARVTALALPESFVVNWVMDGDHSLKPRKSAAVTYEQNLQYAAKEIATWL